MTTSFGTYIRERRRELNLTQEQLSERIGTTVRQADVSRLERDLIGLPRRDRLTAIANALEVSPGELLVRSGWAQDPKSVEPVANDDTPGLPEAISIHELAALHDCLAVVQGKVFEARRALDEARQAIAAVMASKADSERGVLDHLFDVAGHRAMEPQVPLSRSMGNVPLGKGTVEVG